MILWQRVEGALIFVICLIMLWTMGTPLPLWAMVLVFFAPDLSFTGYAMGPRVGAVAYNLCISTPVARLSRFSDG